MYFIYIIFIWIYIVCLDFIFVDICVNYFIFWEKSVIIFWFLLPKAPILLTSIMLFFSANLVASTCRVGPKIGKFFYPELMNHLYKSRWTCSNPIDTTLMLFTEFLQPTAQLICLYFYCIINFCFSTLKFYHEFF